MDHSNSPAQAPRKALAPSSAETKQSYLLLAFGIVIAVVLPFLLRPHATALSAAPPTAMSIHSPPASSP